MKRFHVWVLPSMVAILIFASSCAPQPNKKVPGEFEAGQKYFHQVCSNCHGSDALGKKTKAPGFIDKEFLPEAYSDDEIRQQIVDGSDKMPSQRNKVTDAEIVEIIKYLRYSQKVADLSASDDEEGEEAESSAG